MGHTSLIIIFTSRIILPLAGAFPLQRHSETRLIARKCSRGIRDNSPLESLMRGCQAEKSNVEEAVWQGARSDSGICQMVIIPMRPWGTSRRKAFICKLQHLRQIKKVHGLLVLLDKESAADTLLGGPHDHPTCRCMHIGALWVIAHQFAAAFFSFEKMRDRAIKLVCSGVSTAKQHGC
ncbi:uncharacterized protein An07g05850 [Aspergillus niger]|uniref:Contig An07c0160, genomic contig n=2 Tax=Aspergillus niger TaxID=5061 RepID=E2PSP9_ASPNC|nr:uncharacterized protein An07g05850 [Aspergillus niger]CAK48956.1 unnamed protein product [Aspergillus niger]